MIPALLLALPLLAAARGEISVGAGVSTNPFEVPSRTTVGGTAPEPGTFFPIHGFGVIRSEVDRGFRFGARGSLDTDVFTFVVHDPRALAPTQPLDASNASGSASLPVDWISGDDARHLTIPVEPFAGFHRETFTSPLTARPYVANGISFARRFDTDRAGAKASAELDLGPQSNFYSSISWQRVDYVEDYRSVPGVDSWDYGELRADVDAWFYPSFGVVNASYSFRRRDYDERYPHDSSGTVVLPGTPGFAPQVFWFNDGTVKVGLDGDRGRAIVRLDVERRTDAWGGYLDYTEFGAGLDLRTELGAWTLSSKPGVSWRRYDTAHVAYDPLEPLNQHVRLDVGGRVERVMKGAASGWMEAGWTHQDSTNDLYDFDAVRVMTGVRFSWR